MPVEPATNCPALPDVEPVVVNTWERLDDGAARPTGRATRGVSLKRDYGVQRVRRFAEAWRWLRDAGGVPRHDLPRLHWLIEAGLLAPVEKG